MHPVIGSYVHHNREQSALVILLFQTDFAAHTPEAITAADKLAMLVCGFQGNLQSLLDNGGKEILNQLQQQLKEKVIFSWFKYVNGWLENQPEG